MAAATSAAAKASGEFPACASTSQPATRTLPAHSAPDALQPPAPLPLGMMLPPRPSAASGTPLGLGDTMGSGWPSKDGSMGGDSCKDSLKSLPSVLRDRSAGSGVGSLELGALLGRGSFGKVYKGRWKGAMVAVKVIEHNECVASKLEGLRESVLSANIQHPNVLSTYKVIQRSAKGDAGGSPVRGSKDSANGSAGHRPGGEGEPSPGDCFEDAQETWMLSEFCDRGNLDRAMTAGRFKNPDGTPNMTTICRSLIDVAAGMDYLHSLGVLHADLKGGNVLLKSTSTFDDPRGFICKVGDFGLSRVLETNSTHVSTNSYGTVAYMPAEMLKDGKMTKAVDVYSFAIIMLELFMGDMVFRGMSSSQVFYKVLMGYRPPVPECMPQGFKDLLVACWDENPINRPPFEDIVRWLRKLYYSSDGAGRDNRRSLDLNPWATN
ncbi:hypothetical protein WJX81_007239 [Elliptochloris bilobata]|uniref:Protein kinase domain-containing protein n=1 Tax=Elliptochloris bilobata TaxID=381761 RepID=A0AAW1QZ89_9CHLO